MDPVLPNRTLFYVYIHICKFIPFGIVSNKKRFKQILNDNLKGTG